MVSEQRRNMESAKATKKEFSEMRRGIREDPLGDWVLYSRLSGRRAP